MKITYIEFGGQEHTVDVPEGRSVMEGAVQNGVPGIDANCGGACACATCHVYVEAEWLAAAGAADETEAAMLEFAVAPQQNSRLSCQMRIGVRLDGLRVRLPETQI